LTIRAVCRLQAVCGGFPIPPPENFPDMPPVIVIATAVNLVIFH
jgi:hypothetical protein